MLLRLLLRLLLLLLLSGNGHAERGAELLRDPNAICAYAGGCLRDPYAARLSAISIT